LKEIPILHSNDQGIQRQKSTGCHFHSEEPYKASLYKKDQPEEEYYREDFEECDDSSEEPQINNFVTGSAGGSADGNNFRELFDEFRLREEVKMEIDKRAAVQMGVIVE